MYKGLIIDLSRPALVEAALKLSRFCMKVLQAEDYDTNTTKYYYSRKTHPSQNLGAVIYDSTEQIPIQNLKDGQGNWRPKAVEAVQDIVDVLGYTNAQARNFLENNTHFTFEQIVAPKLPITGVSILTEAEMLANGWEL
jgi:hypothetical protein